MRISILFVFLVFAGFVSAQKDSSWAIESEAQWQSAVLKVKNIELIQGQSKSIKAKSKFSSIVKRFENKRKASELTFKQCDDWKNWTAVPSIGPDSVGGAQIFLAAKDGEYYLLGSNTNYNPIEKYDENGKRYWIKTKKSQMKEMRAFQAWYSKNMTDWEYCGLVSDYSSKYMTSAEYVDGKFYIYHDYPNDQDPHLIIDDNLRDGIVGKKMGMVLKDPTHGSDAGVIRDEDGRFHIIYENWDYNNPMTHQCDAPVAGYAISPDGIQPFTIQNHFPVDERTNPTGETGTYKHVSGKGKSYTYQIHDPEQNAYGDWTAIKVGGQYYLFCDYDEAGKDICIGWFTSNSLNKKFRFVDSMGDVHPDPTIGFAEGQFYLIQQQGDIDYVSSGPWVGSVEARAGVDINNDGKIDKWTDWQVVKESYFRKPGFTKVIDKTPAQLDLTDLPSGYGFAFEYRTNAKNERDAMVVMEQVKMEF